MKLTIKKLTDAAGEYARYSFARKFIRETANLITCYDDPRDFFKDLTYVGCSSGIVSSLIYNGNCRKLYKNHFESMEEFKLALEYMSGEPFRNKDGLPHATFMCWLCYEGLILIIARALYPGGF